MKNRILGIALALATLGGFAAGFIVGQGNFVPQLTQPLLNKQSEQQAFDFAALLETWNKLRDNYIAPEKLDPQKLLWGAIRGLVREETDDYTSFFTPDEAKRFLEDTSGHFEGIGAEIGFRKGVLSVISPLKGTPAENADLRAGDAIMDIDGISTQRMGLEEAVSRIRGPAGSALTLTVIREEENEPFKITITRATITIPGLDITREGDSAIIALYNFSSDSSEKFRTAVRDLATSPPKSIILDLRNNPGGFLDVAVEIAGYFLEPGSPVVIEHRRGENDIIRKAQGSGSLSDIPLVVLVNRGSASAAEILAGALRDVRNIKLVGETTFGKGSVQELFTLHSGGVLKITVGEWRRPSGFSIAQEGLKPDQEVLISEDDRKNNRDTQREAAKALLAR